MGIDQVNSYMSQDIQRFLEISIKNFNDKPTQGVFKSCRSEISNGKCPHDDMMCKIRSKCHITIVHSNSKIYLIAHDCI